ncbi:MAG: hypothetical protein M3Z16_03200 [Pseudomonadota bacterium]|nr:hypothetical protein [Pseudomonadota bacterium]
MKALIFAILTTAFGSASAQTAHTWQLGIYDPKISNQSLGTLAVKGVLYPANTPLVNATPNPVMNLVRIYYVATLNADNNSILSTICPAEWGSQPATPLQELQDDAHAMKEMTYASANAVLTYGNYFIAFTKFAGPSTPLFVRSYVFKKRGASYCMTKDLDQDSLFWNINSLMLNYL